MPSLIQVIPIEMDKNITYAVLGLEQGGRLWYGKLNYEGTSGAVGPSSIEWRLVEAK